MDAHRATLMLLAACFPPPMPRPELTHNPLAAPVQTLLRRHAKRRKLVKPAHAKARRR